MAEAATSCEQEFVVLGKTKSSNGNSILWIADNVYGECSYTRIVKLDILRDSVKSTLEIIRYKDWLTIGQKIGNSFVEGHSELKNKDSLWYILEHKPPKVKPPRVDSALVRKYKYIDVPTTEMPKWNEEHKLDAIVLPEFEGINTELLYYYPYGLYVGYKIDRICYLGEDSTYFYLMVFIKQPRTAPGLDSMHGFFLFRAKY